MIKRKISSIGFFNKTILAINAIAILFLLLSYMAPFTDPRTFWPISFFGLAYPALLLTNVFFVIYWLLFRPKFALISFIAIITGYSFLTGFIGFRESTAIAVPKSSEDFIRVMTYNVHNFKQYGDKNDVFTKEKILDIIRKEQPDVICFQEFFYREKGEYNFKKLIQEIINTTHYYFEPVADNGYEANGMATFSKFPIKEKGYIAFNNVRGNEAIFTDIERNNKIFRVYNVHFQSINFKPEDYTYIKNVTQKIETDVQSSRRIGGRLKSAFLKRSDQVKLIKEHAKSCTTPYLVAGDFNDTPISYTVNSMSEGLTNSFRKKGSGFGITYNGDFPNFQIDYILVSPAFNIKNYRIVDQKLSDHYAVRTDLELN